MARLRSWATARRLRAAGEFDAILQLATGFRLPAHPRLATYEDMTVAQAFRADQAYAKLARRSRDSWIERQGQCYAAAAVCFTLSSWAARSIVEDYGVPADRVAAVGAGRNVDPRPVERPWSPPHFLFAGLDWERKNGDGVLRAFRALRAEEPGALLTVVGDHPEIEEPGVRALGRLSIRDPDQRRRFTGLFEEATCFVMPSFAEPYGIVYREAAAAGIPSIGTTKGGSRDAVGDYGVCVDPDDDAMLLAAMSRLADPESARAIGARGAARREETTWGAVALLICEHLDASAGALR
jgi:glycosyltransferase involved in cell wall biosynthesis